MRAPHPAAGADTDASSRPEPGPAARSLLQSRDRRTRAVAAVAASSSGPATDVAEAARALFRAHRGVVDDDIGDRRACESGINSSAPFPVRTADSSRSMFRVRPCCRPRNLSTHVGRRQFAGRCLAFSHHGRRCHASGRGVAGSVGRTSGACDRRGLRAATRSGVLRQRGLQRAATRPTNKVSTASEAAVRRLFFCVVRIVA
jgi:hypothetical protein